MDEDDSGRGRDIAFLPGFVFAGLTTDNSVSYSASLSPGLKDTRSFDFVFGAFVVGRTTTGPVSTETAVSHVRLMEQMSEALVLRVVVYVPSSSFCSLPASRPIWRGFFLLANREAIVLFRDRGLSSCRAALLKCVDLSGICLLHSRKHVQSAGRRAGRRNYFLLA